MKIKSRQDTNDLLNTLRDFIVKHSVEFDSFPDLDLDTEEKIMFFLENMILCAISTSRILQQRNIQLQQDLLIEQGVSCEAIIQLSNILDGIAEIENDDEDLKKASNGVYDILLNAAVPMDLSEIVTREGLRPVIQEAIRDWLRLKIGAVL